MNQIGSFGPYISRKGINLKKLERVELLPVMVAIFPLMLAGCSSEESEAEVSRPEDAPPPVVAESTGTLPEVDYLGEGAETYDTTLDDFIVYTGGEEYILVPGPAYEASSGERVWAVSGASSPPTTVNNEPADIGPPKKGCVVEYIGIDDEVNTIKNGFFQESELLEIVKEGMVFEGSFEVPLDGGDLVFWAEELVAGWFTPCE